jgi:hypothetical protein
MAAAAIEPPAARTTDRAVLTKSAYKLSRRVVTLTLDEAQRGAVNGSTLKCGQRAAGLSKLLNWPLVVAAGWPSLDWHGDGRPPLALLAPQDERDLPAAISRERR